MTDLSQPPIPNRTYGPCHSNPSGNDHRFLDLGERFGTARWRCEFCEESEAELRDRAAGLDRNSLAGS